MAKLIRFGVSLDKELLDKFDRRVRSMRYSSRSEALRDLIRGELVKKQWQDNREVAGAITLVYDHHRRELVSELIDLQHNFQNLIICNQHIHLDHRNCLEIIAVKGNPRQVQKLADTLSSVRGVKHGTLSMSSTGRELR